MDKKNYKYKCKVPSCQNVSGTNKHFFSFPKATKQRQIWFIALNNAFPGDVEYTDKKVYLCEDHFTNNFFTSTLRTRLHKFAVPTIFNNCNNNISDRFSTTNEHDYCSSHVNNISERCVTPTGYNNFCSDQITDPRNSLISSTPHQQKRSCSPSAINSSTKKRKNSDSVLKAIGCNRLKTLTPRKKKLYFINRHQQ